MRHRGFFGLLYGFVLAAAVALAQDGNMPEETDFVIDAEALRRNAKQSFEKLRHRAEHGDAQTQYLLGLYYQTGLSSHVQKDYAEAVKWYRKAADQGLPGAQFALGRMYAKGKGVPQDDAEATKWYRLAAEQGDTEAQNALKGEIWRCFASDDYKKMALFTLARRREGKSEFGRVLVAGTPQSASFRIAGLNRRWDFGDDESGDSYPYAFIIKPDGTGLYYDFSTSPDGTASASDLFNCLMSPHLIWGGWGELK